MTLKQFWSILRGRRTNFRCLNISWTYAPVRREIVTIYVPDGYKDAKEFLRDCNFERATSSLTSKLRGGE